MKLILTFYKEANEAIKQGVTIQKLTKMDVIERIGRAKYVEEMNVDKSYDEIEREIKTEVAELIRKGQMNYDKGISFDSGSSRPSDGGFRCRRRYL